MWGTSNSYPIIRNYQQAANLYNDTKPLRGRPDLRPLDRRSKDAKTQILKHGTTYIIRLYRTDIITYFEDGSVFVSTGGYNTQSTAGAITAMSPLTCWNQKGECVVSNGRTSYGEGKRFLLYSKGLMFKPDAEGMLVPVDPPVAVQRKKRVNRAKAKEVRAYFKQVPVYIKAFSAAFEGGHKPEGMSLYPAVGSEPLSDEDTVKLAWSGIPVEWVWVSAIKIIQNLPDDAIAGFWKLVYDEFDVVESYEVELPYGEVSK